MKDMSSVGISHIIATVLMLIITTSLSGLAYLYISGTLTSKTAQSFSIISTYKDTVTIQNDGTAPLSSLTATVDGEDVPIAVIPNIGGSVGYWSFNDENNPTADNSGNGNDGTFNGETFNDGILGSTPDPDINDPDRVDGKYGKALEFDGNDDYVNVSNSPSLNPTKITMEAWIKPNGSTGYQQIIVEKGADVQHFAFNDNRNLYFCIRDSGNDIRCITTTSLQVSWGIWQHVTVTYDGTDATFYINGTKEVMPFEWGDIKTTDSYGLCIGCHAYHLAQGAGPPEVRYFNGTIDEVRIFNRALSQEEVQAEMESSRPTTRPVAAWSFEEDSGQYANDTHILVKGKHGSALSFDRTNDYVEIPDSNSLDMSDKITIGAWVEVESNFGNWRTIADKSDTIDSEYWFGYASNNRPCLMLNWTNGDSRTYFYGDTAITDSEWHHIVGVYNGTDVRIYLDGQLDKSPVSETREINHGDGTFQIGHTRVFGANRFNGTIDEVRIFNRALTQEEVSSLHSGLVSAGQIATVKFLTALTQGTHTVRLCTSGMCQGGYLTII